jgi:hypothetical protein
MRWLINASSALPDSDQDHHFVTGPPPKIQGDRLCQTAILILYAAAIASSQTLPGNAIREAKLAPRKVEGVPAKQIEILIDEDDIYSTSVLIALPAFAKIGRDIFGANVPFVRLFLMSNESRYRAVTKALFGQERTTGTGNFHVVTMCLACEKRPPGETETTAVVLHEFGHAWMNTYLHERGRDYLSDSIRRPYLDEGMADWIATRWDSGFLNRRQQWIRELKAGRGILAPNLDDLQSYSSFYDKGDRELHYWISALLIERMIGTAPDAAFKIPRYLDGIGGKSPEQAWEAATNKSIAMEYAALVRERWP